METLDLSVRELAHELNNLFTRILATAQLLRMNQPDRELDAATQRKLQLSLEESARQSASLVKQMLAFRQDHDKDLSSQCLLKRTSTRWRVIKNRGITAVFSLMRDSSSSGQTSSVNAAGSLNRR